MRFLLDSNILIPLLDADLSPLPRTLIDLLETHPEQCVGTAASLWEIAIKSRIGKLDLPCPEHELPEIFEQLELPILPLTSAHAVGTGEPWPDTKDPFDRILLSICAVERLQLLTTDGKLKDHPLAWRA
jgi:PIN domain nuclease of toxin-antitoxin system